MSLEKQKRTVCVMSLLALGFVGPSAFAATPGYGAVDIALGKPVTPLTGTVLGDPTGVTDGTFLSNKSYWYSVDKTNCTTFGLTCTPTNPWGNGVYYYSSFTLDLGSVYSIGKVSVLPLQTRGLRIYSSLDGTTWTQQHKLDGYDTTGLANATIGPLTFTPNGSYSARYFKYEGWAWWYQYVGTGEFAVYEWLPDTTAPPDLSTLTNLALGKTATTVGGSPAPGHASSLLTDGNPATYWEGNNDANVCNTAESSGLCPDGTWYNDNGVASVDLGSSQTIQAIRLTFPAGGPGIQSYIVNLSDTADNSTAYKWWTFGGDPAVVASKPPITTAVPLTFYLPAPVSARYVFINVTNQTTFGVLNPAVGEVEVYGTGGSTSCTYTLDALSRAAAAAQSNVTVGVTAASGCAWTTVSNASWITVTSGASGSGNGTAGLQVAANTGTSRTGTATIAGQTFTVTQAAPAQSGCSFNVNPTDIHATAAGISNTLIIFTNTGCAWTTIVPSGIGWITLNPTTGSGGGAVGYSIPANTGAARNTTIVVAGTQVTVEQDAASSPCTYALSGTSQSVPGLGGANAVVVTVTGTGCAAWTVSAPTVSWLHVTSPTGSTTTGTVGYSVDPNTGTAQRSATLTVANQSYTVTEDVPPCTYSLSAANSPTFASAGGTGSVQVATLATVCPWAFAAPTASTQQWVHITTAANAAGTGGISYSVDPNTTTSPRSLSFTLNGQKPPTQLTYTITQAAALTSSGPIPVVTPGGLVNAASFISANLPAGAIAQGSFFSIFGTGLGPDPPQQSTAYPLPATLAGVSVKVTQGSTSVQAIPMFVAPFQINAVMPSNAPIGTVQVTVTYNGATSPAVTGQVVATSFGAFSISGGKGPGIIQNYVSPTQLPLNMSTVTAAPGDIVILWGTGLGPLPNGASDSQPPAGGALPITVSIALGNQTVQPLYAGRAPGLAGVDQINFQVPQNAQPGCYVPVQVTASGVAGNTITMAIQTNRQACSDANPLSALPRTGGKNATIALARLTFTDASKSTNSGSMDLGLAIFEQQSAGGALGFDFYSSMPPRNSCTAYSNMNSLNAVMTGGMPSTGSSSLDAGSALTITGSKGARAFSYSDASAKVSPYFALLGASGTVSSSGLTGDAPFLDPGTFTLAGNGGSGVGPFSFPVAIASGAAWTNRDQIQTVDRSRDLAITWSGGDPAKQVGVILGMASDPGKNTSGGFACLVTLDKTTWTVPASMMTNLPATNGTGTGGVQGGLFFLTFPTGDQFVSFTSSAPAIDNGMAMFVSGDMRSNVTFK